MKSIEDITGFDELMEEQNHPPITTSVDSETSDEILIPEEVEEMIPQSLPDENSHYEQLWNSFSNVLTSTDRTPAQKRLFCKIDSDLAYTIDKPFQVVTAFISVLDLCVVCSDGFGPVVEGGS